MLENQNTTVVDGENDPNNTVATGGENSVSQKPVEQKKTFSQEDVNRIVSDRLYREKIKLESDLAQRELELNQKEFMFNARAKIHDKGLPPELMDALNTSSQEAFDKSLEIIEQLIKKNRPPINYGAPANVTALPQRSDASLRNAMGLK